MTADTSAILAAIERHGADLDAWPDAELADTARAAALHDTEVRAAFEDARHLAAGVERARAAVDEEIDRSGAIDRVVAGTLAAIRPDPARRMRRVAIAAALVLAAALGGVVGLMRSQPVDDGLVDMVVLDPLVFGPTEVDRQ